MNSLLLNNHLFLDPSATQREHIHASMISHVVQDPHAAMEFNGALVCGPGAMAVGPLTVFPQGDVYVYCTTSL